MENLAALDDSEKKKYLVKAVKNDILSHIDEICTADLEKYGIFSKDIRRLFGTFQKFRILCGISSNVRKANMTDGELREYLISIKIVDPDYDSNPTHRKLGSICHDKCICWITDKYHIDKILKRQNIRYKNKTIYLYRLSYLLFKGLLPVDQSMVVSHTCDNSLCFNPDHLEVISQQENVKDCVNRGRFNRSENRLPQHGLKDLYDYPNLLKFIISRVNKTEKDEWLWLGKLPKDGYPRIGFNKKTYQLPRLVLANKLGINYEQIKVARHLLLDGSEAQRHDLNPDHLYDGTHTDNANDRKEKWTLSRDEVLYIRGELQKVQFTKQGDASAFDFKLSQVMGVSSNIIKSVRLNKKYTTYAGGQSYKGIMGRPVVQLDMNGKFVARYDSITSVVEKLKLTGPNISNVCNGKLKSHKGFIWKFEENYSKPIEKDN